MTDIIPQKVVKDNALMNASYDLNLVEQRLIVLAIIEARESGKGINANDPLFIHSDSYIKQFNVSKQTAYQALKDACSDLFAREFSYMDVLGGCLQNVRSRWVTQVTYVDDKALVSIIFAPAVVPLITRLEKKFTSYEIKQINKLTTGYAIRVYELLITWRNVGKTPIIPLDEFRDKIGVLKHEYPRLFDFKKRILNPSIEQINKHTDIIVKVDDIKKGRSVTGFTFSFKFKKDSIDGESKEVKKLTAKQIAFFSSKLSELQEFQSVFESKIGEDYADFASRIAEKLEDAENVQAWIEYLNKVGYK